jgi:hypothetical protein
MNSFATNCAPPPLTDTSKPWVVVTFIHADRTARKFYSVVSEMTGDRLSSFHPASPSLNDDLSWVRSVVRDIGKKAKGVVVTGSLRLTKV